MKAPFLSLVLATVLCAQTPINIKSLSVSPDAIVAINNFLVTQTKSGTAILSGAISDKDSAVKVDEASAISGTDVIKLDAEAIQITSKSGNSLTVTRGALGTMAASHADKSTVQALKYPSITALFQQSIADLVARIMDQATYPTKTTQDAAIAAAIAAKEAAKTAAVQ